VQTKWRATDLFAGCGGLSAGLARAGFQIVSAVENNELTASTYRANHPKVNLIERDISKVDPSRTAAQGWPQDRLGGWLPPPVKGSPAFGAITARQRPKTLATS
jgi:DNA (cytosine-5)-methyltransferase 1